VSALGGRAPAAPPGERRAEVADWLLGQQEPNRTENTRAYLATSPEGRAWTFAAAAALRPIAGDELPDLPVPAPAPPADRRAPAAPWTRRAAALGRRIASRVRRELGSVSSRTGLLLLGAVLATLLAVVALGLADRGRSQAAEPGMQALLTAARPGDDTAGTATIRGDDRDRRLILVVEHLPPSTPHAGYAVWLTRGGRAGATVAALFSTDARGNVSAVMPLEKRLDPGGFREMLVTRQRRVVGEPRPPAHPGLVVLRGPVRAAPTRRSG
jgi:hypothetical protein